MNIVASLDAAGFESDVEATPFTLVLVDPCIKLEGIVAYDPQSFKTRPGLWVSSDFMSRVQSKAQPVRNLGTLTLISHELSEMANNHQIRNDPNLPTNHVFEDESEFVARLDQMIQKQCGGEEGDLISRIRGNVFYLADDVVSVSWHVYSKRWMVFALELNAEAWGPGDRVFSRV